MTVVGLIASDLPIQGSARGRRPRRSPAWSARAEPVRRAVDVLLELAICLIDRIFTDRSVAPRVPRSRWGQCQCCYDPPRESTRAYVDRK